MADIRTETGSGLPEPLTDREREILTCLMEGLSNQEISARLHLALRTVKWYNSHIYSKLGVSNRKGAVERTQTLGLLRAASDTPKFAPRNNLPLQLTRFVGRQEELASIANQLSDPDVKLVTIVAPGGMGKTRLALATAERQVRHFRDGVFFVPLAALSSPEDIITAIADSVGFSFYGSAPHGQQLLDYFRERHMLLVLDNFEHLLDGALLVADILQSASGVRVLTTSLERLNLGGETVYELRGLDFPVSQTSEHIQEYDAVRLFILSAQRVHPGFEPQADDLTHLARICQLTAGMPLAIELAAGWLDTLSLEHIANEIQQGIDILETDLRDLPERHRSVRATFERTWSHLTDDERVVFMRLSVFRGGFSLQAAQAVASANAHHLRRSVQKALIQTEGRDRFAIHELLRQFGADKLAETGELPTMQARHAAFFADFMQARRSTLFTGQQFDALDEIGVDFENIRSAWNVLVGRQAFDDLRKFLDSLWFFLDVRTRGKEGVELFEATANTLQSLPSSDATELALARLWTRLAWFYNNIGLSDKGQVTAEAAIHLLNRHDSPEDLLVAYQSLALIYMFRWDHENTRRLAEAGCELARKLGDRYWEAHSLIILSHAARMFNSDTDAVLRPLRQARTIFEHQGNSWGMVLSYATEAQSAFAAGDYEQVKHWSAQCQVLAKAFGSAFFIGTSAAYLGIIASWQEDDDHAWALLRQSLFTFWDASYAHFALGSMVSMAQLLLRKGEAEFAVEILALTDRYPGYRGHGALLEIGPDRVEKLRAELEARLGADHFAAAWALGEKRELSAVVAQLLSEDINK